MDISYDNSLKNDNIIEQQDININEKSKDNSGNLENALKKKKYSKNTILNNIKTDINSSLERRPHLKRHKKKKITQRNYPFTSIIKNNNKLFKSLINNQKDNNPININENEYNKQNITFSANSGIKHKLLKEYNEMKKIEKKYRRIKKRTILYDSFEDNEDSSDDDENNVNFYISSDSIFIFIFDLLLIFFSFYAIFFVPLELAQKKYFCEKESILSMSLKYNTEYIFILDVILSFIKSYYNYEFKKIINLKKIIKHYLRHHFIIDLIESFPSYSLTRLICEKKNNEEYYLSKSEIIISIFLILKGFKIFKILNNKNNRVIELLYEKISKYYSLEQLVDFLLNIIIYFSFFHILVCIHIFIGNQSYLSWITLIHIEKENLLIKYISSFYFIITTMTTVGFGDIVCVSKIERNFQIILLAIGTVIYSFIITTFGNYIGKQNNIQIELNNKKNILEKIRITHPSMPFKLYYKIHNYLTKQAYQKQNNKNNEIRMLVYLIK